MPPRKRPPGATEAPARGQTAQRVIYTPRQFLDDFVRYLDGECGMSQNTIRAYRTDLERFLGWCQKKKLVEMQKVDLKILGDYLEFLRETINLAASSLARNLVSLKMFFRYLVLEGVLLESAVDLLNSPKLWQHLPHVLSPEMVNQLLDAPQKADRFPLRDRAFLALMYATGCRVSELANMQLRDVHLEENYCRALGKGNKERLVSLNPVAIKAIRLYLEHERPLLTRRQDPGTLFVSKTGRSLTRIMLWTLVKRYAQRVGASDQVSPHTLRHSFATHMLAGGAEIRALQEMLGHASIATTQIYTHVEHSRLKAVHVKCHPRG